MTTTTREPGQIPVHRRVLAALGRNRLDLGLVTTLWATGILVGARLVSAVNSLHWLTAEEISVMLINPSFFPDRIQASHFSSNPGGTTIFLIGKGLGFDHSIYAGREWKAICVAAALPLLYVLLRRLEVARWSALIPPIALLSTAAVQSFMWLGIETGLELTIGLAACLVATIRRPWAALPAGFLVAFAAVTYPSGIAFLFPCGYLLFRHSRFKGIVLEATGFFMGVAIPPLWLKAPHTILFGGGRQEHPGLGKIFSETWDDLLGTKEFSYYFFSKQAAISLVFVVFVAIGGYFAIRTKGTLAKFIAVLLITGILPVMAAGGPPGIRRLLPVVLGLSMLTAFLIGRRTAIVALVFLGLMTIVTTNRLATDLRDERISLGRDWVFTGFNTNDLRVDIDRMAKMPYDDFVERLRTEQTDPMRTIVLVETARKRMGLPNEKYDRLRMRTWKCKVKDFRDETTDPFRRCRW